VICFYTKTWKQLIELNFVTILFDQCLNSKKKTIKLEGVSLGKRIKLGDGGGEGLEVFTKFKRPTI